MCGIVGYVGKKNVRDVIIEGLHRLEYRGYDSAGIATTDGKTLVVKKAIGKISDLEKAIQGISFPGSIGMGHTRWATHGGVTEANAHPHTGCPWTKKLQVAVAHNGIIENYRHIKTLLEKKGHMFTSETDTEVIAHLIEEYANGSLFEAVRAALNDLEGAYAIVVISKEYPHELIAARNQSPLVLGVGKGEYYIGSDPSAFVTHTRDVIHVEDGEIVRITPEGYTISLLDNTPISRNVTHIDWDAKKIEKGGYDHYMKKEIDEQPHSTRDAMRGRIDIENGNARLRGIEDKLNELSILKRIIITACGTSWHAGLVGEYLIEELARIPVEVEYASEFRYRSPIIEPGTAVLVISQSGETADTLAALREAKRQGGLVLGICNVIGSTIARETHSGVYLHAGPEIGVASTKAFTSQITVLTLLSVLLARSRGMSQARGQQLLKALADIPEKMTYLLRPENEQAIKKIAEAHAERNHFLYLGRGINFPVALEGALKLKEISYIHAEGYPAAEMKHGPIALIDKKMPSVIIALKHDPLYPKIISNMEEILARGGDIIAVATEEDGEIEKKAKHVLRVPTVPIELSPLVTALPLQMLAYYAAVKRGCEIDQPRNLAKSVTVE
ncbi:MAG: glutamine--fructose-6-phosphate aminotransferase [Candidatus Kerfeldbacteria bacterium RIFCSPLOWO2_01_FULL_48_11]|uniref:Glutamine--fructose-6-phosphate aminotransferase [isomerizing] n=1 Tax=Candidatus Kerfeldbacteria bacterium RIFCSPLOWO2_01_FULL_48_11 TaxID=1798543 RepID=A0A1G2B503_9BACT|nr:MAG: Isomerizing Glutamine-fructose-6-phosphate aminotransferase [Parcubacteria group bacterium GW2011_GWA2_48_9]KKW13814.1 MAG: Isomerizing Glutamine-fructose-6-phosphate aminotransferase [Parcubacteria group bacterium GW2011_GWC2_49_9]OGY83307.1 MAG: glutamine--fructose-6-phosphate aminotransferase [Candidatus Kerfeldbacteria bacterium RIFCSPLOWO2_01_FULL_48_11]